MPTSSSTAAQFQTSQFRSGEAGLLVSATPPAGNGKNDGRRKNNKADGSSRLGQQTSGQQNGRNRQQNNKRAGTEDKKTPAQRPSGSSPNHGLSDDHTAARKLSATSPGHDPADATLATKLLSGLSIKDDPADSCDSCLICASDIVYYAVPPCNHRSCDVCSLRLRALYKTNGCPQCRVEAEKVIFTQDKDRRYEQFEPAEITHENELLGIRFTAAAIYQRTQKFCGLTCPFSRCSFSSTNWGDLKAHLSSRHHRSFCDICVDHKKVFSHEQDTFTKRDLERHRTMGSVAAPTGIQDGFAGHPECNFCQLRFYGDDELLVHCRNQHERCYICDGVSADRRVQYYRDYHALERHFQERHFPCGDLRCLERKFVVFETEAELRAHQHDQHPNANPLPRAAGREMQRVDMATFTNLRAPVQERGQDRFRYSLRPVDAVEFVGQPAASPRGGASASLPATSERFEESAAGRRLMRHEAVLNRAMQLSSGDMDIVDEFKAVIAQYREDLIDSEGLVCSILDMFDAPSNDVGLLVTEVADLFNDSHMRRRVLRAWCYWRAINEDFPALTAPPAMRASAAGWGTSDRHSRHSAPSAGRDRDFPALPVSSSRTPVRSDQSSSRRTVPGNNPVLAPPVSRSGAKRPISASASSAGPVPSQTSSGQTHTPAVPRTSRAQPAQTPANSSAPLVGSSAKRPKLSSEADFPALPESSSRSSRTSHRPSSTRQPVLSHEQFYGIGSSSSGARSGPAPNAWNGSSRSVPEVANSPNSNAPAERFGNDDRSRANKKSKQSKRGQKLSLA